MRLTSHLPALLASLAFAMAVPAPAYAYMGPGLGMGAVMTSLGVVGAILLGLFSILWYPAKRMLRRLRRRNARR